MSLLAPFKLCLQCLPVFSSESPPPSPRASSVGDTNTEKNAHLHSQLTSPANASAECALSEGEKPSFSDASLIHDNEQKDLPISKQAKIELVDTPHAGPPLSEHASRPVAHVHISTPEARSSPKVDTGNAQYLDVSQPAYKQDSPHITVMPKHDVEFVTSGMTQLPSPITPAPIGLGYIVGQHSESHHVHHQVSSHHNGHSFFHIHSHDKAHRLSSPSHSTHEKDPSPPGKEHASPSASSPHSSKAHESPPLSASSQSGKEQLASYKPSEDKGHESKEHSHHRHSPIKVHGNQGDVYEDTLLHPHSENPVSKHGDHPHPHEKNMETSHSEPHINLVASHAGTYDHDTETTSGRASSALVTSHSEPMEAKGGDRVRWRDQFKHHLKELHDQVKEEGQHLKEEGSKHLQSITNLKEEGSRHLQSMVSNMNKHAGQVEEPGVFSMVPRVNSS